MAQDCFKFFFTRFKEVYDDFFCGSGSRKITKNIFEKGKRDKWIFQKNLISPKIRRNDP